MHCKIATMFIMGTARHLKRRKRRMRFSHVPIESTCTLSRKLFLTFLKILNSTSNAKKQRTKRFLFSLQQLSIWRYRVGGSLETATLQPLKQRWRSVLFPNSRVTSTSTGIILPLRKPQNSTPIDGLTS